MLKKVQATASLAQKFNISGQMGKFQAHVDQPAYAGGDDTAPTPLDYLLFSMAACQATIARIIAMQRRIDLRAYEVEVTGELDTDVLLGKSNSTRCGFQAFTVRVHMDADMTDEEKRAFIAEVDSRCPVSENLHYETPIQVELV